MSYTILMFDDQPIQPHAVSQVVSQRLGYRTIISDTVDYGIGWITSVNQPQPDLIMIDLTNNIEGMMKIIRQAKAFKPQLPIVVVTQYGQEELMIPAIDAGATDFISKPTSMERIRLTIQNVLKIQHMNNSISRLERKYTGAMNFNDLVGQNKVFASAMSMGKMAAGCSFPVWIDGEHGTGREVMARAIHGSSDRAGKPFISINCERLQENGGEALLFGSSDSTKPGSTKLGRLREAGHGTIYLREITNMPMQLQHRILELINHNELQARIICSNSKNTDTILQHGHFSQGLYDRLRKIRVPLPPLRERKQDIKVLAENFMS